MIYYRRIIRDVSRVQMFAVRVSSSRKSSGRWCSCFARHSAARQLWTARLDDIWYYTFCIRAPTPRTDRSRTSRGRDWVWRGLRIGGARLPRFYPYSRDRGRFYRVSVDTGSDAMYRRNASKKMYDLKTLSKERVARDLLPTWIRE